MEDVFMAQLSLVEDFNKFRREPSVDSRALLVKKISQQFNSQVFAPGEREIASEILSALSYDVEKNIRKIIANELKNCADLPHDIAMRLAYDIEEIASPILEFSEVLTDDDLTEIIISSTEIEKFKSIAKRKKISEKISEKLVETDSEDVVTVLFSNKGASISEKSAEYVVKEFDNPATMLNRLVERGGLSVKVAEKIVTFVSTELQSKLIKTYNIKPDTIITMSKNARERSTLNLVHNKIHSKSTLDLVNHLYSSGKLSHSIILRSLCRADVEFFEVGLAKLAGIPRANAKKLIKDGDDKGFHALFNAASMPSTMLEATETLLQLISKEPPQDDENNADYSKKLISQIVRNGYDRDIPNMRYFLALIGNNALETNMV